MIQGADGSRGQTAPSRQTPDCGPIQPLTNKILLLLYNLLILANNQPILKKSITILILSLLFFSQIGYRFVYIIQQHMLKEAAEEQILSTVNQNQLEQINEAENNNAIVWEEEGKEFSLNGQMYDVAKKEIVNGKAVLYCLNDLIEFHRNTDKESNAAEKSKGRANYNSKSS